MQVHRRHVYLIVPADNVDSLIREVTNVEEYARASNLTPNHQATKMVFRSSQSLWLPGWTATANGRHRPCHCSEDSWRHFYWHFLGVTAHQWSYQVMRSNALRAQSSSCDTTLQGVFRSVVVSKLMYASSAWFRIASKTDQQRVDAYLRRSKKCGLCPPELPSFQEQCDMTLQLFDQVQRNIRLLFNLLPHLRHHHRTTISGQDHISVTLTFLQDCFSKTFNNIYHINRRRFLLSHLLWNCVLSIFY